MASGLAGIFPYQETELDPAVQAEILLESARAEARVAILMVILAFGFALWLDFGRDRAFNLVALFCVFTVAPLLLDAYMRRRAAKRLMNESPGQVLER